MPVRHPSMALLAQLQHAAARQTDRLPQLVADMAVLEMRFLVRVLVVLVAWFGTSILCLLLLIYWRTPSEGYAERSLKTPARRVRRCAASPTTLSTERSGAARGALYLDCSVQAGTPRIPGLSRFLAPLSTPSPAPRTSPARSLGSGDSLTSDAPFATPSAPLLDQSLDAERSEPLSCDRLSVQNLSGSPTGTGQRLPASPTPVPSLELLETPTRASPAEQHLLAPPTPVPTLLISPPAADSALQSQSPIPPTAIRSPTPATPAPTRAPRVLLVSPQQLADRLLEHLAKDDPVPLARFLKVQPSTAEEEEERTPGRGRMATFI